MADFPRAYGPYSLLKSLGSGGTGEVFLARPDDPDRGVPSPVVVKCLHAQLADQSDFVQRFRHEAEIAVNVDSAHVAKVYDVGRVEDSLYIAIEYLPGWTLAKVSSELDDEDRDMPLSTVRDVVLGALDGLHALHTAKHPKTEEELGIVHRDIAPKNIMVCEDGDSRLIDLGLGKSKLQDWKTETGVVMGSPGYMAPEQVIAKDVDHRVDLYAMGIILWELLTGGTYFKRAPVPIMLRAQATPKFREPSALRSDLPAELGEICRKALSVDPADRFQSAKELSEAVRSTIPESVESPASSIVGEMLWGELQEAQTEVTQLLEFAPQPDAQAAKDVEVFAERSNVVPIPAVETIDGEDEAVHVTRDPSLGIRITPAKVMPEAVAAKRPPAVRRRAAESKGVPLKAVVGLVAVALVLGIGAGGLFLGRQAEPVQEMPTGSVVAEQEPAIVPVARSVDTEPDEPASPPVEKKIRPRDEAPAPQPTPEAEPLQPKKIDEPPASAPEIPTETNAARASRVIAKARAFRATLEKSAPNYAKVTVLISQLAKEAAVKTEDRSQQIREYETALSKLGMR